VVYLAEHTRLGRKVALKTLRTEYTNNPISVKRFFAEARAVNRISHHNIVEITDFIEQPGGDNYYIMELLHGETLCDLLERGAVPPVERSVRVMVQVASALEAVHDGGIIHRDLKPENIYLVARAGQRDFVKILDFGVAQLLELADELDPHRTGTTTIVGTPEYMSPEQAAGQDIDHRTDVYAFGVMLYELLTGKVPFEADSFGEMVVKHMTEPPVPPSQVPGLPHAIDPAVEQLVLDCLAKDRALRPPTMDAIQNRLIAIAEENGWPLVQYTDARLSARHRVATGSQPPPVGKPAVEPPAVEPPAAAAPVEAPPVVVAPVEAPRRRRLWIPIAAGVAVVAVVAGMLLWATSGPDRKQPDPPPVATATVPIDVVLPPAPPTAPQSIDIEFRSTPPGAAVYRAGTSDKLGVTPWTLTVAPADDTRRFELRLDGYEPASVDVPMSRSALLSLSLTPIPAAAPPAPAQTPATRPRGKVKHGATPGTGTGSGSAAPAYTPEERDGVLDPLAE
jgi:serine/threonine-protein kinase